MTVRSGIKGLKEFQEFANGRKRKDKMETSIRKKLQQQLIFLRRDIIKYIDSESHGVKNSPLTIMVKGSSRPLVDRGDLRNSINWRTHDQGDMVFGGVGVLRTRKTRNGKPLFSVATALHEGFVVKVTPKVRAAVFAEMRKRRGKKIQFTGGGGSKSWKVKGRPFIKVPFKEAVPRIKEALGDGVKLSFEK